MITITLRGGIGNQLFQWALGRALSEHTPVQYDRATYADGYWPYALDKWVIEVPVGQADPHDIHVVDTNLRYRPDLPTDHVLLDGYWQSEHYFEHIRNNIRWELKLRNFPHQGTPANDTAIAIGRAQISCFMHVRRYLPPDDSTFHGLLPISYYKEALSHLSSSAHVFVFSDDPIWCKQNLIGLWPHMTMVEGNEPHIDIWLMSLCQHAIIANSSFSWWAAWLGPDARRNPSYIFAPKQWFAKDNEQSLDIVPARWKRL